MSSIQWGLSLMSSFFYIKLGGTDRVPKKHQLFIRTSWRFFLRNHWRVCIGWMFFFMKKLWVFYFFLMFWCLMFCKVKKDQIGKQVYSNHWKISPVFSVWIHNSQDSSSKVPQSMVIWCIPNHNKIIRCLENIKKYICNNVSKIVLNLLRGRP